MKIDQQALKKQVKSTFELVYNHNKSTKSPTAFNLEQIKTIILGLLLDQDPKKILENVKKDNTVENLFADQSASEDNLKMRYRALSLLFHPDKMDTQISFFNMIIKKYGKDILFQSLQLIYEQLTPKQKTPLSHSIKTFEPFFDAFSATEICEKLGGVSMPNLEKDTGNEILSLLVTIQQQEEQLANANFEILEWQASKEYLNLMKLLVQYAFTTNKTQFAYGQKASLAGLIVSMATYLTLVNTPPLGIITNASLYGSIILMLIAKSIKGICYFLDYYYQPQADLFKNILNATYTHSISVDRLANIACLKQMQLMIKIQIRALEACSPGFEIIKNTPAYLDTLKWPNLNFGSPQQKKTAPSDPFLLIEWPQHTQPFEHKLTENEEFDVLEVNPIPLEDGWEEIPSLPKKAM